MERKITKSYQGKSHAVGHSCIVLSLDWQSQALRDHGHADQDDHS